MPGKSKENKRQVCKGQCAKDKLTHETASEASSLFSSFLPVLLEITTHPKHKPPSLLIARILHNSLGSYKKIYKHELQKSLVQNLCSLPKTFIVSIQLAP
jgi:hypothetical protein